MATITCLKDLNNYTLSIRDTVIFQVGDRTLKYSVFSDYLNCYDEANDAIFELLNVDKFELASDTYGYTVKDGWWPYFKGHDFEAVTRLVKELYKKITTPVEFVVGFHITKHPTKPFKFIELVVNGGMESSTTETVQVAAVHNKGKVVILDEGLYKIHKDLIDHLSKYLADE